MFQIEFYFKSFKNIYSLMCNLKSCNDKNEFIVFKNLLQILTKNFFLLLLFFCKFQNLCKKKRITLKLWRNKQKQKKIFLFNYLLIYSKILMIINKNYCKNNNLTVKNYNKFESKVFILSI